MSGHRTKTSTLSVEYSKNHRLSNCFVTHRTFLITSISSFTPLINNSSVSFKMFILIRCWKYSTVTFVLFPFHRKRTIIIQSPGSHGAWAVKQKNMTFNKIYRQNSHSVEEREAERTALGN